jgi:hypothetical protein
LYYKSGIHGLEPKIIFSGGTLEDSKQVEVPGSNLYKFLIQQIYPNAKYHCIKPTNSR